MTHRKSALPLAMFMATACICSAPAFAGDWTRYGGDIHNTRNQADETTLSVGNVGSLEPKWTVPTTDVTSTAAVEDGYVYFSDWGTGFAGTPGYVYRVEEETGRIDWKKPLGDSTGFPVDWSRSTPTIAGDLVLVGNQGGRFGAVNAKLVALNKVTGATEWVTDLDDHFTSIATSSPTVYDGVAYVGVASYEEAFAALLLYPGAPLYPCCSFRGSVVAVDVATGEILWKTYMAPEGFSGNSVWGSAPAVDVDRNQVYVATGNNYSAPESYYQCLAEAKNDNQRKACSPGENYYDSIVALKLDNGRVNWVKRVMPTDTWNVACLPGLLPPDLVHPDAEDNCTFSDDAGPDFDFAQAPMLYMAEGPGNGKGADMIGVGQKSGVFWALKPSNGDILWSTRTGPGGIGGGHQWGSATDGQRIYTSNANSFGAIAPPYELADGSLTQAGIFSALDASNGDILWQIANPAGEAAGSPAAVANGVMYVCSVGGPFAAWITLNPNKGYMYAIDAATGQVLRAFESGASCGGGAAIANGKVFWGHGYASFGGTPGYQFVALGLPD